MDRYDRRKVLEVGGEGGVAREDALYGIVSLKWTKVSVAEISSMIRNDFMEKLCKFFYLLKKALSISFSLVNPIRGFLFGFWDRWSQSVVDKKDHIHLYVITGHCN